MVSTICVALSHTGWAAGTGMKRGVDLREIDEHSDLVVIWGGNPVNTQVNVMSHAGAAKRRGATLVVIDPYRTGTAERADLHLALRPGTDGALACAVMHVLFREGTPTGTTWRPHRLPGEMAPMSPRGRPSGRRRSPASRSTRSRLRGALRLDAEELHPLRLRLHPSHNGAVNMHAVSCLPAVTGAWQHPGGGAL